MSRRIKRNPNPTFGQIVGGCVQWWIVYLVVFLFTFPLWSGAFLWTLKTVLEGLNSFGGAG